MEFASLCDHLLSFCQALLLPVSATFSPSVIRTKTQKEEMVVRNAEAVNPSRTVSNNTTTKQHRHINEWGTIGW